MCMINYIVNNLLPSATPVTLVATLMKSNVNYYLSLEEIIQKHTHNESEVNIFLNYFFSHALSVFMN